MPVRIFKTPDIVFAAAPLLANLTLAEINEFLAFISGVSGLAFLYWRWWKSHKREKLTGSVDTSPPIPPK